LNLDILNQGFIPKDICLELPEAFSDVEKLAAELPKVLANEQIESRILLLEVEKNINDLSKPQLERAMLIYSYIGHAFMWGKKNNENIIPAQIAKTWFKISQKLERPPILSYASYALNNWKMLDSSRSFDLENIVIVQNFLGGVDEDWFIMIHVAIEHEAKEILSSLKQYFFDSGDKNNLEEALISIKKINAIMNRMPEKCDPFIYYNRVRPYIFGWKNNPTTPDGVVYEGVDEYNNEPQIFRGETGAQSSIVPILDALLGVTHSDDPLKEYLDEMRLYMPKEHRDLLNDLDSWSQTERKNVVADIDDEDKNLIAQIIKEVHIFRNKHLEYARIYIYEQSLTNDSNSNIVGTGGTPFMKYLDKHLQETVPSND
jgi:indoleamine 2,3-dioxygenase|tara:strand:+ start:2188 stop:3306 length:1119 start_codon:yes stop_codon:yes gene_type:complete